MFHKKQSKTQKLVNTLTDTVLGAAPKKHTKKKVALAVGIVGTAAVIVNEALKPAGDSQ